ncbi:FHA domain-containing protein [Candidatus Uabimicrobium sp. HlEnr_7]|uniref:FHA domain-containing protein n=1 Tax=Candidatus Uabimicrobium helgolandensis TaxID=3095367 RepID=UPI00355679DA
MGFYLCIIKGTRLGTTYQLKRNKKFTIGRSSCCDFHLEDSCVSAVHSSMFVNDKIWIVDENSRNKTFVNGKQISKSIVKLGDVIQIGDFHLQLKNKHHEEFLGKTSLKSVESMESTNKDINIIHFKDDTQLTFGDLSEELITHFNLLHSVGKLIHQEFDIPKLLAAVLETTINLFGTERGCIFLKEPLKNSFRLFFRTKKNDIFCTNKFPISQSVVSSSLEKGTGTVSRCVESDKRFSPRSSANILKIYSVVSVPIQGKNINGAIYLDSLSNNKSFCQDDLNILTAVGKQVGLAIEHKETYRLLKEAQEELEKRVDERTKELQKEVSRRKKIEQQIIEVSEREQQRISHDLHDSLGQLLTGIKFLSYDLEKILQQKSSSEINIAQKISSLVNQSINHARNLAHGISPVELKTGDLCDALCKLSRHVESIYKISCVFIDDSTYKFSDTEAIHLYRIAQESVNNALKHGKVKNILVKLESHRNKAKLTVQDDGIGIQQVNPAGMGLNIMEYRAQMIDAILSISTDKGTIITCCLK